MLCITVMCCPFYSTGVFSVAGFKKKQDQHYRQISNLQAPYPLYFCLGFSATRMLALLFGAHCPFIAPVIWRKLSFYVTWHRCMWSYLEIYQPVKHTIHTDQISSHYLKLTDTYTHEHTHTHMHSNLYINTRIHTSTHANSNPFTHIHIRFIHSHLHTDIHTHMGIYTHAHINILHSFYIVDKQSHFFSYMYSNTWHVQKCIKIGVF